DGSALPSWLTFDAATQHFGGTPAAGSAGTYQLRLTATDRFGASASDLFQLDVTTGSNLLQFTKDACWPTGSVSAGCIPLDGKGETYEVYNGGPGVDTLLGTDCADAILLQDDISPRPPGTSGPRISDVEIIDAAGGDD